MAILKFKHDRAGDTSPLTFEITADGTHGAIGPLGVSPRIGFERGIIDAQGWAKRKDGTDYPINEAEFDGAEYRLTVKRGVGPISTVHFVPLARNGVVDVNALTSADRPQPVFPEELRSVQAIAADAQAAAAEARAQGQELAQLKADTAQQQAQNNQQTAQAVADAAAKMEQTRAEALKLGPVDKRFISLTTANPRLPTVEEWQAAGGHDSRIIGAKLTADGGVQLIWYNGAAGWWEVYGAPTYTSAQAARTGVDAALYGVREGASAQTLMDAIAATPDGGTLVCPRVKLIHRPGVSMMIRNRHNVTIQGNGLVIEADPALPDGVGETGHGPKFEDCSNWRIYDLTYDGRLDVRTPIGGDASGVGGHRGGFIFSGGTRDFDLYRCHATRCMMDGYATFPREGAPHDHSAQPDFATNIRLHDCTATYNYRQGISLVGSNDFLIDGGEFAYTGMLGEGKYTWPFAGLDSEAWSPFNHWNVRLKMINSPRFHHNRGAGVILHMGTQFARIESASIYKNGEGGIGMDPGGVIDNYINADLEDNCTAWEENDPRCVEVNLSGARTTLRGTIRTPKGAAIVTIYGSAIDPDVSVHVINTNPKSGVASGFIEIKNQPKDDGTPGTLDTDPITGEFLGWDKSKHYVIDRVGGCVHDCVIENGTWEDDTFLPALKVTAKGTKVLNNEMRRTADISSTQAAYIGRDVGYSGGNRSIGYIRGIDSFGDGDIPALPAGVFSVFANDGLALSSYDDGPRLGATLLARRPGSLLYRVGFRRVYDPAEQQRKGWYRIAAPEGYSLIVTACNARRASDDNGYTLATNLRGTDEVEFILPKNDFLIVLLELVVEVRRA